MEQQGQENNTPDASPASGPVPNPDGIYGSDTQVAQTAQVQTLSPEQFEAQNQDLKVKNDKHERYKAWFVRILISSVVSAAAVAVVAVLVGEFSETLTRALGTILLMGVHASIAVTFALNNERDEYDQNFAMSVYATFALIIISFITSVFWLWGIIGGEVIFKTYVLYLILLFAAYHGELLAKTLGKTTAIDALVYINYIFMAIVVVMLTPVIYATNPENMNDLYLRILAASAIVDATLTIVAMILFKQYLDKHPEEQSILFAQKQTISSDGLIRFDESGTAPRSTNIFVKILFLYLFIQFGLPILWFIFSTV